MNIFVTDEDPIRAAMALDDIRVNKMITESCQMLATALIHHGCPASELPKNKTTGMPYKASHVNHPCTVWARANKSNYAWLMNHMMGLLVEWQLRTGQSHWGDQNLHFIRAGIKYIPEGPQTPFPNCSLYKEEKNIYEAYRKTLTDKWMNDKRKPKWTKVALVPWFYKGHNERPVVTKS